MAHPCRKGQQLTAPKSQIWSTTMRAPGPPSVASELQTLTQTEWFVAGTPRRVMHLIKPFRANKYLESASGSWNGDMRTAQLWACTVALVFLCASAGSLATDQANRPIRHIQIERRPSNNKARHLLHILPLEAELQQLNATLTAMALAEEPLAHALLAKVRIKLMGTVYVSLSRLFTLMYGTTMIVSCRPRSR